MKDELKDELCSICKDLPPTENEKICNDCIENIINIDKNFKYVVTQILFKRICILEDVLSNLCKKIYGY